MFSQACVCSGGGVGHMVGYTPLDMGRVPPSGHGRRYPLDIRPSTEAPTVDI